MDGSVKKVDESIREGGGGEGRLRAVESSEPWVTSSVKAGWGRNEFTIIGIAVLCGLAIWVIDAVLDYLIFYEGGTFLGVLITDMPKEDVYDRLVVLAAFTVFGILISRASARRKKAMQRLEEFRLFVESVEDYAIFMLDLEGHVISWNAGAERIKGYKSHEIIGKHFCCFYTDEDIARGKPDRELERAIAEGQSENDGWRLRKDGSRFWANAVITATRDESGNVLGFRKVTRDITDRKKAMEEVAVLAKFLSENPNPVLRIRKDGEVLYSNEAGGVLLGKWKCEIGKMVPEKWGNLIAQAFESKGSTAAAEEEEEEVEGTIFSFSIAPIREAGYANLYGRDITERKKAAQKIAELAKFPAENPNPVIRVSKDGRILYSNDSSRPILALWGCEDSGALSGEWHEMISEAHNKEETQEAKAEWAGKIYSLTFAPVRDSDFVNVYGLDITDREKAEEEKRTAQAGLIERGRREKENVEAEVAKLREELIRKTRLAAIGQVSASIAHDLRNPLGSVRNASYFLRRHVSKDEPKLAEYTEIIDQEIAKADQIITNLLEMARPKAPHKQEVDLGGIVKEVFSLAKGASGVHCEMSMVPDPFDVQADANQLRQVVSNIVDNAIESMRGQGDFFVEFSRDAGYDTIVFRDTGPGFAPETKKTAFEPLITTKASGTGLGLTICIQIIEDHGGSIAVEEYEGRGAGVRIRLPRE